MAGIGGMASQQESSQHQLQQLAIASQHPPNHNNASQSSRNLFVQVIPEKRDYVDDDTPLTQLNSYLQPGVAPSQELSGPSSSKKRSSAQSARTGQACDRCKNRKIKCDPSPEGCQPCRSNNTECKTTDRITGRASVRGHAETIERDNMVMRQHISNLEQQIRELGIEPKAQPRNLPPPNPPAEWARRKSEAASQSQDPASQWARGDEADDVALQEPTHSGADIYLGVSPRDGGLSVAKGMSMSLFGVHFDIGEFVTDQSDERVKLMSRESIVDLIHAAARTGERPFAHLPDRLEECLSYAHWYFVAFNAYFPILHRPHFIQLISVLYTQEFKPTTSQTVQVHIMLAIMKLQYAIKIEDKTAGAPKMREALNHFHYALTFWIELYNKRSFDDIQALVLICVFMRFLPSPDNAWTITNAVFSLVIELGYHRRDPNPWDESSMKDEILRQELRKRVFHAIMALLVKLNGRLGRPMPVRPNDYDIQIPEYLNDDLEKAAPGYGNKDCTFYISIVLFHEAEIFLEMFSTMYALKPTVEYEKGIKLFEQKIDHWTRTLPEIVSEKALLDGKATGMAQINATWLRYAHFDLNNKLHHPALCRSQDPEVINRNIDICVDASKQVLKILTTLFELKSIDATWMIITDAATAIFTLLYAMFQRRERSTPDDLVSLKKELDRVMPVVGEIAKMFGAGAGFRESLEKIVDISLGNIRKYHTERTKSLAAAAATSVQFVHKSTETPHETPQSVQPKGGRQRPSTSSSHLSPPLQSTQSNSMTDVHDPALMPPRMSYTEVPQYRQYQAAPTAAPAMQQYAYNQYQQPVPDNSYTMLQGRQRQQYHGYAAHQAQGYQQQGSVASDAWRQWAESARAYDMNDTPAPRQDYMNTGNTMVALGGHQDLGGSIQGQGGAERAAYGLNVNNSGIRLQAGPFPHMIQDATMHAALTAQGWNIPQSDQFIGNAAPHDHGQGMQNEEQ